MTMVFQTDTGGIDDPVRSGGAQPSQGSEQERRDSEAHRTESLEAEAANRRLTTILESIDEGFIQLDAEWRYTYVNAAAERFLSRHREEVLGRTVLDLFPQSATTPQYAALRQAMAEQRPVILEAVSPVTGGPVDIRAYPSDGGLAILFRDLRKHMEAEAARLQLAAIVESSEDAIIGKTLDGIVTSWNAAAERLYGYTASEMIGQSISCLVAPDQQKELPSILERLQAGESFVNYETTRVRKDGRTIDVALSISLIRDGAGTPLSAAAIARDISGRKQAEAALRRQAALLNLAPVAILVSNLERRITFWNRGAERTYGRMAQDVLGRVSHEVLGTEFPLSRDEIEATVLREGSWEGELRHRRADGEEVVVLSRWSPELDQRGRPIGMLQIDRDITDRKRAEQERQRLLILERAARQEADAARRRSALLASVSERLAETTDPGSILAGVAGLTVPDMADWCVVDLLDSRGDIQLVDVAHRDPAGEALIRETRQRYPLDRDRPYGPAEVLRTGRPQLYPVMDEGWLRSGTRRTGDPELLHVLNCRSAMCVPLIARDQILGAITFGVSASDRRYDASDLILAEDVARRSALALDHARLHDRLQKTMRLRETFLASVAHDFKNPLHVIQGFTKLLRRRGDSIAEDSEVLSDALQSITESTSALADLVDGLQDIVTLEAGRSLSLERAPVDLVALAREAAAACTQGASREVRVCSDGPELVGEWDRGRVQRILDNLLSNATKYSPEDGEVVVTIEEQRDTAMLRVRDNGIGIPAEDLPRVFERFHRGRNVLDRIPGSGLGLWGVKRMVEEHGGSIVVESAERAGTTVTVVLPLQAGP